MTLLALLLGCPPRPPPVPIAPTDPMALLEYARTRPAPGPTAGSFSIRIETPETRAGASGSLVVSLPNTFRLEVRGPIGGPVLVVACDGTALNAWQAQNNTFFDGADVGERLAALTGGVADLGTVASLLLGRVPDLGAPAAVAFTDAGPLYVWESADHRRLLLGLDARTGRLVSFEAVDADGQRWVTAAVEPDTFPERLQLAFPVKRIAVDLEFTRWIGVSPDPSVFSLTPPPGAAIAPLRIGAEPPQ